MDSPVKIIEVEKKPDYESIYGHGTEKFSDLGIYSQTVYGFGQEVHSYLVNHGWTVHGHRPDAEAHNPENLKHMGMKAASYVDRPFAQEKLSQWPTKAREAALHLLTFTGSSTLSTAKYPRTSTFEK